MKVLNLCLGSFYIDNYSYQENLLPKYMLKSGYDVEIIASLQSFDKNGRVCYLKESGIYTNENGIKVTRLKYRFNNPIGRKLKVYKGLKQALELSNPDIIFIHGSQFLEMKTVVKYLKKHRNIKVYVDNHCDFSNSGRNFFSKNILHKILWRRTAKLINPFTTKFFGVLPARVDWLINMYKLPKEKCELLVMGADDELVKKYSNKKIVEENKKKYLISNKDFVIVTGGKIDMAKLQTLRLMQAVEKINKKNVKLFIFGSVDPLIKEQFDNLCSKNICYLGWANVEDSYKYFSLADLVVFPGRHSVYWEQCVAMQKPLICKRWDGTTHIDIGGNVMFLENDTVDEIYNKLNQIILDDKKYKMLLDNARKAESKNFLYSKISKRAIS